MKILQVIPYFEWSYGGPVKVVHDLAINLIQAGHEVDIYTTNVGRETPLTIKNEIRSNIFRVNYFNCSNNNIAEKLKIHYSSDMLDAIKNNLMNYDIVHLHEARGIPNIYIWYYACKYGIPYIIQAHGSFPKSIGRQNFGRTMTKMLFDLSIGNKIFRDAAKFVALTPLEGTQYKKFGVSKGKIEIIPNGIDVSQFINLPQNGEFRRKYKIKSNEKIILYLGRINKIKGLDLLVRAFHDLEKNLNDVKLVIVGPDDGFKNTLINLINSLNLTDRILIIDPLYGTDKLEAYVDADVYVLPSVYEMFPLTVLEACICGTPVIVTDRCAISYIIENLDGGYVTPYDQEQLMNSILYVLKVNETKQKFRSELRKTIMERFDWRVITNQYMDLYNDVIDRQKSS